MKKSIWLFVAFGLTGVLGACFTGLVILRLVFVDLHFIPQSGMYPTLPAGRM